MINLVRVGNINNHSINFNNKYRFTGIKTQITDTVTFSGRIKPDRLFVFDLDGSFAEGINQEIQQDLTVTKDKNALLIYATSRTLDQLHSLINKMDDKGIKLPLPDIFIASNGQFIYEKKDNQLILDESWMVNLKKKTGFDRQIVYDLVKQLGQTDKYRLKEEELAKRPDLEQYKQRDPDFWNSKISYYEFCPSEFFLEFMATSGNENLHADLEKVFEAQGIKAVFNTNVYPKSNLDKYCSDDIKDKARPFRINDDGGLFTLHIGAAEKSDAVEFIRQKLNLPYENVICAGDGHNDICLAELTKKGARFICLPATDHSGRVLLDFVERIYNPEYKIAGRSFNPSDPKDIKNFSE